VEGLGMRGMIDLVKEYPGEDIPYIFTAKKPPKYGVWESDKLKAGAYILIMQAQGLKVEEARIVYLADKEDAEREVPMNGFLKERILKTRDAVIKLLEGKEVPPRCKKCKEEFACYG
ncbi:MAG: hypothetical protein ABIA93_04700, partial [Candidatus Woesearchaeota archaeon]